MSKIIIFFNTFFTYFLYIMGLSFKFSFHIFKKKHHKDDNASHFLYRWFNLIYILGALIASNS